MKNKRDIMWKLTVDVNGRQEYTIKDSDYDAFYEKMTDIYIKETL